jgi:hypothetical protein
VLGYAITSMETETYRPARSHGPHSLGLAKGSGEPETWTAFAATWMAEQARAR